MYIIENNENLSINKIMKLHFYHLEVSHFNILSHGKIGFLLLLGKFLFPLYSFPSPPAPSSFFLFIWFIWSMSFVSRGDNSERNANSLAG